MTTVADQARRAEQAFEDALAIRRRRTTLWLLTFAYFFSYMDRQILAILQERIRVDLSLTDTQLGLLAGFAFALFYATLGIPVARLADRMNRRNIIAAALATWSLMTAFCGLAQNFGQLLAARIGVGIGEAGSSPPSHSIITDLYPPNERAGAMGFYSLGVVLGAGVGTFIGGTVAHFYGWRAAMFTVGIPGIVLAFFIWRFVVEPRRGLSDVARVVEDHAMPSLVQGFASMWAIPAARHLVMAVTLTSMVGYGLTAFVPSYLQRALGMRMLDVSLYLGPLGALSGAISAIVGGRIADRLGRERGLHWQSWMVAILKLIALPFMLVVYWMPDATSAIAIYLLSVLFANSYLGPSFALIQGLAPVKLRALWAAITLLVINLVGLGLGPTMVGWLSEQFKPTYGDASLGYAMLVVAAISPWAIFHYWRAGVLLKRRAASLA